MEGRGVNIQTSNTEHCIHTDFSLKAQLEFPEGIDRNYYDKDVLLNVDGGVCPCDGFVIDATTTLNILVPYIRNWFTLKDSDQREGHSISHAIRNHGPGR
jgi:hypothetical protein